MYDSVNVESIPPTATMVAGYVDGLYANTHLLRQRFPKATLVEIAVNSHSDSGHVLDVETGDATPTEAVSWVLTRRRAGADPSVYCNASEWPHVRAAFKHAAVTEPHYWIAKWDNVAALLPGTVAKQFKNTTHYDESVVADYWPGVDPKPKPTKPKTYKVKKGDTLSSIAVAHKMTLKALEKKNPQIKNFDLIYPGEVINL
jgi:nucleoid-associated protein YgaU